jgi:hypothetical protein
VSDADKLFAVIQRLEIAIRKGSADAKAQATGLVGRAKASTSPERAKARGGQGARPERDREAAQR